MAEYNTRDGSGFEGKCLEEARFFGPELSSREESKMYRCSFTCESQISFKTYCVVLVEENHNKSFEQLVSDRWDLHVLGTAAICPVMEMGISCE